MSRAGGPATPFIARGRSQPVPWRDWRAETFAAARDQNRPLLVYSGASWCGACATLDREAFDHPEIASLLRDAYVPVRLDRDLRPDIDARLQQLAYVTGRQAGWPLLAFLTPEGELFHAGTRFAHAPVDGRPALAEALRETAAFFRQRRDRVAAHAERVARAAFPPPDPSAAAIRPEEIVALFGAAADGAHGGFGNAPKFPLPAAAEALLAAAARGADGRAAAHLARRTLLTLARTPLRDPLDGGFRRGARDAAWREPWPEKRLVDNAALLRVYALAARRFPDESLVETTLGLVGFLRSRLGRAAGSGFAAALPAGTPAESEARHAWTSAELGRLLSAHERIALAQACGVRAAPDGRILTRLPLAAVAGAVEGTAGRPLPPLLASAFAKLDRARETRPAPPADPTPFTGANAEAARGLLAAAALPEAVSCREAALATLDGLLAAARSPEGPLRRVAGDVRGVADAADHALLGLACLAAHEATGQDHYRSAARDLAETLLARFWDEAAGAFRDAPPTPDDPFLSRHPLHPVMDLPDPSTNGAAALLLVRLGRSGEADLARVAARVLAAQAGALRTCGPFAGLLALACAEALDAAP